MAIYYQQVKEEMQGAKGLISLVRSRFIPSSVQMAKLAQLAFENENVNFFDIDSALDWLLTKEYKLYRIKQDQVDSNFVSLADELATEKKYPTLRAIIDDFLKNIKDGRHPADSLKDIGKIFTALADSNRQSRVSRAGSSLMEHISYLLQKNDFIINSDFNREQSLGGGCKVDYIFPNIKTYQVSPENCFAIACQTTSNDRFRLSLAQMPQIANTRNRACTAIGCENFGEKLGPQSLTTEKLNEARKNNVKFVIIGKVIDERLKKSNTVMSYNELFSELKHMKPLWNR